MCDTATSAKENHETVGRETDFPAVRQTIVSTRSKRQETFRDLRLEEHGDYLLACSIQELGIDPAAVERIARVARTIANLDGSKLIKPIYLCEAINYRSLDYR